MDRIIRLPDIRCTIWSERIRNICCDFKVESILNGLEISNLFGPPLTVDGKFDASDRLFSSISRTWESAYQSLTDVKELIPQFYDGDGAFLLNTNNLNLGVRSDKKEVHDVELPKWAKNPRHFVETLRKALESEFVNRNLHLWIDLIWGHKQRGPEAERAFNKFYYLTYEGAIDLSTVRDKEELRSIQMQINEFGQTPSQLFLKPHPAKFSVSGSASTSIAVNTMDCGCDSLYFVCSQ